MRSVATVATRVSRMPLNTNRATSADQSRFGSAVKRLSTLHSRHRDSQDLNHDHHEHVCPIGTVH